MKNAVSNFEVVVYSDSYGQSIDCITVGAVKSFSTSMWFVNSYELFKSSTSLF